MYLRDTTLVPLRKRPILVNHDFSKYTYTRDML